MEKTRGTSLPPLVRLVFTNARFALYDMIDVFHRFLAQILPNEDFPEMNELFKPYELSNQKLQKR